MVATGVGMSDAVSARGAGESCVRPPSWPVLWSAMAADRHPQAKAHKDGRKAENEKRDAGARDGRQPEVAADSPKDDATASQGDGKCNRTPHRVGSFRLRSLPSLPLLGGRLATRPMLRILAELPRATCASLLEFDATHDV